jgi:hypothetical protein
MCLRFIALILDEELACEILDSLGLPPVVVGGMRFQ